VLGELTHQQDEEDEEDVGEEVDGPEDGVGLEPILEISFGRKSQTKPNWSYSCLQLLPFRLDNNFFNLPPYTVAGFDLTTHSSSVLDGIRRRYHSIDHAAIRAGMTVT
jgi:hypothetical protein